MKSENNITAILAKCKKSSANMNDRFWRSVIDYLGSISTSKGHPDFLSSWTREAVNLLKGRLSNKVFLVLPEDGNWGIQIKGRDDYSFSYTDGANIYISYRLYSDLKQKNDYKLFAGFILHILAELIMQLKADKKGREIDYYKNHGEALRLEKGLLGKGLKSETKLRDYFLDIIDMEMDRRKVQVDKKGIIVGAVAESGEELVVEVSHVRDIKESVILQLVPGESRKVTHFGTDFIIQAVSFKDRFTSDRLEYDEYVNLMKILDTMFIEESIIHNKGPFKDFIWYLRELDYSVEHENNLLKIIWLYVQRKYTDKMPRHELLYKIFLIVSEYLSYFAMRDIIKEKYWPKGLFVKENIKKITEETYKNVSRELPGNFLTKKEYQDEMSKRGLDWFCGMHILPSFVSGGIDINNVELPKELLKYYKKSAIKSILDEIDDDVSKELGMHEGMLSVMGGIENLNKTPKRYSGINVGEDERIYELEMAGTGFWRGRSIYARGEMVNLYSLKNESFGLGEIIDVKENSIVVFMENKECEIPEDGYVKKLEDIDLSVSVSERAVKDIKTRTDIIKKLKGEADTKVPDIPIESLKLYNKSLKDNTSQCEALCNGLGKGGLSIIQGPPGTGKTTVIAEIILQLLERGNNVLLSSQTHNAVDNALKSVMKQRKDYMGIGRAASTKEKIIDHDIRDIWIRSDRDLGRFEHKYKKGFVIGSTNVGTHTLDLMKSRKFDVLVMDEAGKANLVESILPMLLVKKGGKLIIVGDHKQGTPFAYDDDIINLFIKNEIENHSNLKINREKENLIKEKLNMSLFQKLIMDGYPKTLLNTNYRSSYQIVSLISQLFYDNELEAKDNESRKSRSVIVLDTSKKADAAKRKETEVVISGRSRGYKNTHEAELIVDELKEVLKYRYIATGQRSRYVSGVTILTPYVFQVEEIRGAISREMRRDLSSTGINDLLHNVMTIDSFQGRENDAIIISFTRSNKNPSEVGFLRELNRINVALSRAKRKMVLIGDFSTLTTVKKGSNAPFIRKVFRTIYNFR